MRKQHVTTVMDLAGAGLIVSGAALVYVPAALILAGAALLAISWRLTR